MTPHQAAFLRRQNKPFLADPLYAGLRKHLLTLGGSEVVLRDEPHLALLSKRGKRFPAKGAVLKLGEGNACHTNAARLWKCSKVKIVTGWALSGDGLWRQHTWGWTGKHVIETTEKRTAYFGVELNAKESEAFWKSNPVGSDEYDELPKVLYHGTHYPSEVVRNGLHVPVLADSETAKEFEWADKAVEAFEELDQDEQRVIRSRLKIRKVTAKSLMRKVSLFWATELPKMAETYGECIAVDTSKLKSMWWFRDDLIPWSYVFVLPPKPPQSEPGAFWKSNPTDTISLMLGGRPNPTSSKSAATSDALGTETLTEDGVVFETGRPVEFDYVRGTTPSPNFGARFQQDIEPAGRYMIHVNRRHWGDPLPNQERGTHRFERPLVLAFTLDPDTLYGPTSWKARLRNVFKAKGKALSRKIAAAGYDGIVTVWLVNGKPSHTKEIVDLAMFKAKGNPVKGRDWAKRVYEEKLQTGSFANIGKQFPDDVKAARSVQSIALKKLYVKDARSSRRVEAPLPSWDRAFWADVLAWANEQEALLNYPEEWQKAQAHIERFLKAGELDSIDLEFLQTKYHVVQSVLDRMHGEGIVKKVKGVYYPVKDNPALEGLRFLTSCVEWSGRSPTGDAGSDIQELKSTGKRVSREAFLKHVDREDMREIEESLSYAKHPSQGLTMAGDRHVGYFRGRFCGKPVYYFVYSGIEHIFMDPDDVSNLEVKENPTLSPRDKKVIDAFVARKKASSPTLDSDGRRLHRSVGNEDVARWMGDRIVETSTESTRHDQTILRYLRKKAKTVSGYGQPTYAKGLRFFEGGDAIYQGQWDGYIVAYVPQREAPVGRLDYSEYGGRYSIKMVEVDPAYRRYGVSTALFEHLLREHKITQADIDRGMQTEDGHQFRKAVDSYLLNPSPDLVTKPMWHGTNESAWNQIKKDGGILRRIVPQGKYGKSGRSQAASLDRIYVSTDPFYAAVYAIGGVFFGLDLGKKYWGDSRYGWLLRVEPDSDADLIIDEDQMGELAVKGEPSLEWLHSMAKRIATNVRARSKYAKTLWDEAQLGEYAAWIRLGKLLIKRLTPDEIARIIPYASQFAIRGNVRVVEAWRIDKSKTLQMQPGYPDTLFAASKQESVEQVVPQDNPITRKLKPSKQDIPAPLKAAADGLLRWRGVEALGGKDVLAWVRRDGTPAFAFQGPALSIETRALDEERMPINNRGSQVDLSLQQSVGLDAKLERGQGWTGVQGGVGQTMSEGEVSLDEVADAIPSILEAAIGSRPHFTMMPLEGEPYEGAPTPYYSAKKQKVFEGQAPGNIIKVEVFEDGKDVQKVGVDFCTVADRISETEGGVVGTLSGEDRFFLSHAFSVEGEQVDAKASAKLIKECGGLLYPSLALSDVPANNFGLCTLFFHLGLMVKHIKPYKKPSRGAWQVITYDTDAWTERTQNFAGDASAELYAQLTGQWEPRTYGHMMVLGPEAVEGTAGMGHDVKQVKTVANLRSALKAKRARWKRGMTEEQIDQASDLTSHRYPYLEVKVNGILDLGSVPLATCPDFQKKAAVTFLKTIGFRGELIVVKVPEDIKRKLTTYVGGKAEAKATWDYAWLVRDAVIAWQEKRDTKVKKWNEMWLEHVTDGGELSRPKL